MNKKLRNRVLFGIVLLGVGYWYFFSNYFTKHLFYNDYGTKLGERWHWEMDPFPWHDSDGTSVLVDYSKNELAVVLKPPAERGLNLTDNDTSGISVGVGGEWIAIPEMPNHCIFVDASGARVGRSLKPGEAKRLFEQLQEVPNGHLRAAIPTVLGIPESTTSTTNATSPRL